MNQTSPKRPGVNQFDQAPTVDINRSTFDLSHPYKTTFDSGNLIPIMIEEILPGDSFKVDMTAFTRLATPIHPTMDNLWLESFFFFVPNRLVWDNWQKFMGEQDNPGDSTDFTVPTVDAVTPSTEMTIYDYAGMPMKTQVQPNALPFRAMNLIWNEWFRDENLQNSLTVPKGDGPDGVPLYTLQRRGKRKDYFSSCLPWPQKGPGVDLPLGTTAPIRTTANALGADIHVYRDNNDTLAYEMGTNSTQLQMTNTGVSAPGNALYADLTNATASTINDLRMAFQIQKLQERDARGGTRYTEILKSHFLVTSPDARLQRPEYLGGGKTSVQMHTVPQTSNTAVSGGGEQPTTPQGNLSAYGTSTITGHGFTKSFVEHGFAIGFVSVRADLNHQYGLDRFWSRRTKYDYYWPALQALGEQPVYNREIYNQGTSADDQVWGYQERWAEYKTRTGKITGLFRSNATGTLDPWHYAISYESAPALDATWIQDTPPVKRTIAVQNQPEFLFDAWLSIKAARPMPTYSVPGYIDHF